MTHKAKTVRLWQEIIPAHPLKGIVLMVIWAVWFSAPQDINLTGSFWQLLNPLGLLAGVVSLSMLLVHGPIYLQIRTEGEIAARARRVTKITGAVFVL